MSKLSRKIQFARDRGIHVFDARGKVSPVRSGSHYVLRFPKGFNPRDTNRWWTVMINGDFYPVTGYTHRQAVNTAYALALEHAAQSTQEYYGHKQILKIVR